VLKRDEHGRVLDVADDEDELENVQLVEQAKLKEREATLRRLRFGGYRGYDDDEFDAAQRVAPGTDLRGLKKGILTQYDDHSAPRSKIMLPVLGQLRVSGVSDGAAASTDGQAAQQTLHTEEKEASEFYTKEEFAKLKRRKVCALKHSQRS
jgi:hypothetical protein